MPSFLYVPVRALNTLVANSRTQARHSPIQMLHMQSRTASDLQRVPWPFLIETKNITFVMLSFITSFYMFVPRSCHLRWLHIITLHLLLSPDLSHQLQLVQILVSFLQMKFWVLYICLDLTGLHCSVTTQLLYQQLVVHHWFHLLGQPLMLSYHPFTSRHRSCWVLGCWSLKWTAKGLI